MTTVLYGTPAPIDHEDHAAFLALVERLLANPTTKPKTYLHKGIPLVHYAVRTRNVEALHLLAKAGLHLNKPFKEDVWNYENPSNASITPLDEALRTDDPAMVQALFQAGLDPSILVVEPDWNKHPYRTILRAGYEPAPCMVDALLEPLDVDREAVVSRLVVAIVKEQQPFTTLIRHLFDAIKDEDLRVSAATVALFHTMNGIASKNHPSMHLFTPVLLDAGARVDGTTSDPYPGFIMGQIARGMRPSAKREYLVKRLLEQKPDLLAEVAISEGYFTTKGSPFLFAIKANDPVLIDAFLATGTIGDRALLSVNRMIETNEDDWTATCTKALDHVRPIIVAAQQRELEAIAREAMRDDDAPTGARDRARL